MLSCLLFMVMVTSHDAGEDSENGAEMIVGQWRGGVVLVVYKELFFLFLPLGWIETVVGMFSVCFFPSLF